MRLALITAFIASQALALDVPYSSLSGRYRDGRGAWGRGRGVATGGGSTVPVVLFSLESTLPSTPCTCPSGILSDQGMTVVTSTHSTEIACFKGNETSGIANGDLVWCPANTVRVMPGGDGSGGNGLPSWQSQRNGISAPNDFTAGTWSSAGSTPSAPVVTADQAIAPDGTTTADKIHFPATGGGQASYLYATECPVNHDFRGIFVKGAPGNNGSFILANGAGSFSPDQGTCTFNDQTWTRCGQFDTNTTTIGVYFLFGVLGPTAAFDVYVAQADCQDNTSLAGPTRWPPPVRGVSVTRSAEVVEGRLLASMWADLGVSLQFVTEDGLTAEGGSLIDLNDHSGTSYLGPVRAASALECDSTSGATHTVVTSTATIGGAGAEQLSCYYDGNSNVVSAVGAAQLDGGIQSAVATESLITIGSRWNGVAYVNFANGVVKHPKVYTTARKTIGLFGDSIVECHTAGPALTTGGTGWPQNVLHADLGNRAAITNYGVSGYTSAQVRTALETQLAVVVDAGTAKSTYWMVQACMNDGADAGGCEGNLQAMLLEGQDAGVHMLWSTITPNVTLASFIAQVNSDMTTFCAAHSIPKADTWTPLNGSGLFVDAAHLTDGGCWVETETWRNAGGW